MYESTSGRKIIKTYCCCCSLSSVRVVKKVFLREKWAFSNHVIVRRLVLETYYFVTSAAAAFDVSERDDCLDLGCEGQPNKYDERGAMST